MTDAERIVADTFDALRRREPAALDALLHPEVRFHTRRAGEICGRDAVREFALRPRFEHLDLELGAATTSTDGDRFVVRFPIRLRWRESGAVADEATETVAIRLRDGLVVEIRPLLEDASVSRR